MMRSKTQDHIQRKHLCTQLLFFARDSFTFPLIMRDKKHDDYRYRYAFEGQLTFGCLQPASIFKLKRYVRNCSTLSHYRVHAPHNKYWQTYLRFLLIPSSNHNIQKSGLQWFH